MKSVLIEFQVNFLIVAIVVLIIAFTKWYKYAQEQKLRSFVAWTFLGGYGLPLLSEISNAQYDFGIQAECRIADDTEWAYVKEIIDEYKKELIKTYLEGNLRLIKSKYRIRDLDHFMYTLYEFLSYHICDYEFIGHSMHEETLHYKSYGRWGGELFDATYSLTDFAIAFCKLRYITYMYCNRNDALKSFVSDQDEKYLKKHIETKQLQVSRI